MTSPLLRALLTATPLALAAGLLCWLALRRRVAGARWVPAVLVGGLAMFLAGFVAWSVVGLYFCVSTARGCPDDDPHCNSVTCQHEMFGVLGASQPGVDPAAMLARLERRARVMTATAAVGGAIAGGVIGSSMLGGSGDRRAAGSRGRPA